MKALFYSFLLLALISLAPSCNKQNQPQDYVCKSFKNTKAINTTADSLSCIEFSYNAESKTLTLDHINTSFNCCPKGIDWDIKIDGNIIIVTESERKGLCDCMCLYDMHMEIEDIEMKTYTIKIIEQYSGDQEQIIFNVDLNNNEILGSYCVTRLDYPWGLSQWE